MAARFARDAEVGASTAPFRAVRRDTATPRAEGGEQMRELMAQGAIDFRCAVRAEPAIQEHTRRKIFSATGRAP
jgi:hypothetical protein